jgi:nickel transport system ATP-binding protein
MQNPMNAFDPCMKIKGHFAETLRAHMSCSKKDAVLYGLDLLKDLGMKERDKVMKSYPHQLSGGMLQRAMIALAVAINPVLIIADEPTTALDNGNEAIVLDLLAHVLREYAPAMLLVSHDIEVLAAMADHVAVMKAGKILEMNETRQLFAHPQHDYTKELLAARRLTPEEDGFADD